MSSASCLHSVFNEWFADATESDYAQLETARERIFPGQVCSIVTLVRRCLDQPDLQAELPESLVQLLTARCSQQLSAASKAV